MNAFATTAALSPDRKTYRVESIDLLRGAIMIIMALDHVRDYFHASAFLYDPTDLTQTSFPIFMTRWITHYCAPVFMFLSGTSAYLVGIRKGKKALAKFLLTRGLWLVFLELTVVNFAWYFNIKFPDIDLLVIWALGISMITLAGFIFLPVPVILVICLAMVFGHNLLDTVNVPGSGTKAILWSILHKPGFFQLLGKPFMVIYPIIPWIGVMALGYCLGTLYNKEVPTFKRRKWLFMMGLVATILFIIIRSGNKYGDASKWVEQKNGLFTVLSFINVSKYPPSLLYLLMTLGPALFMLALIENKRNWLFEKIKVIGRVPMFYYLLHIYLLHFVALFATYFSGHKPGDMILSTFVTFEPKLQGYGFSLAVTYAVWFCLIIVLYFACRWYDKYKRTHQHWWLSYL
jgi:uncharacterized membrane protein